MNNSYRRGKFQQLCNAVEFKYPPTEDASRRNDHVVAVRRRFNTRARIFSNNPTAEGEVLVLLSLICLLEMKGFNNPALCLASLSENKDGAPTPSCDQRRVGSSQSEVSVSGELQRKLPAPTQAGHSRRDR